VTNTQNLAQPPGEKRPVAPGDSPRREEKLQKTLEDIKSIIDDQKSAYGDQQKTNENKNKLRGKKTEIEALDIEMQKHFKETEEKIKDLPKEIQQRHRDFVKSYDENMNELKANLDAIDKAKTKQETNAAIAKAKAHLEKVRPSKRHQKLDPNKLPHETVEPVKPTRIEARADQTTHKILCQDS
jgi:chromosome segregation ATPase